MNGISFWRCFFEEESKENHYPGYFFGCEVKGNPSLRCFFEEKSRVNVFRGYFFEGGGKEESFSRILFLGWGKGGMFFEWPYHRAIYEQ